MMHQDNHGIIKSQRTKVTCNVIPRPYHTLVKKVEWIRRIPFHGVATLSAFGIEEGNPFRDCIDR